MGQKKIKKVEIILIYTTFVDPVCFLVLENLPFVGDPLGISVGLSEVDLLRPKCSVKMVWQGPGDADVPPWMFALCCNSFVLVDIFSESFPWTPTSHRQGQRVTERNDESNWTRCLSGINVLHQIACCLLILHDTF